MFWKYTANLPVNTHAGVELFWNRTLLCVFSRKFAAYFQNTFSWCSENIQQIYRWTPMLEWNFFEIALCYACSPVNLLHIFRTPFPKITSGGILLKMQSRLAAKPKIFQSLSACKNHSINLLDSWNDLCNSNTPDFIAPWSKRSPPFLSIPTE